MKTACTLVFLLLVWSISGIQGPLHACRAVPIWVRPGAFAQYVGSGAVVEANASLYGISGFTVEGDVRLRWDIQSVEGGNATVHVLLNASAPLGLVEAVVVVEIQTRMCYGSEGALGITWFWISSDYVPDQSLDVASLVLPPASVGGSAIVGRVRTPQGLQESFHTIIENQYFFDYPGMEYRRRSFAGSWERDTGIFAQGGGHFLMPTLAEQGIFNIFTGFWFADTNVDMGPEINPYAEIILSVALVVAVIATFTGAIYYLVVRRRRVRRRRIRKVKRGQRRYRSGWSGS